MSAKPTAIRTLVAEQLAFQELLGNSTIDSQEVTGGPTTVPIDRAGYQLFAGAALHPSFILLPHPHPTFAILRSTTMFVLDMLVLLTDNSRCSGRTHPIARAAIGI
jgi:hypothetical protein